MPIIQLPAVKRHIYAQKGNFIQQYFNEPLAFSDCILLSKNPFVVSINEVHYFITNDKDAVVPSECNYAFLVSKKPTEKDLNNESLKILQWLKHPAIKFLTPEEVTQSWTDKFKFVKENPGQNIKGLRPPQLGALYSILAHLHNPDDIGIVVMPTGTGKTETMLCSLIANQCSKLLVAVPSDSLRTQLEGKFSTLGLLREFGIIDQSCHNPIVGILNSRIQDASELETFIAGVNVVITTMNILADLASNVQQVAFDNFTHLFVDEAHHSKASTWDKFIGGFNKSKVFLFTATPYRNDGKRLNGKFIFNFSLKNAQEQKYYKKINYLPIREYDKQKADEMIAERAVQKLREDLVDGYQHIILARCMTKNRANDVFKYYEKHQDLNPIVIYTGVPGKSDIIEAIKRKEHFIIVCVDMLGEGFDLPELKIAAIHDERQSIPITLQFIGRFTRTSYDELGDASFITNAAYPPIKEELDQLYAKDADWNLLLPLMSEGATQKEIDFKSFLAGFTHLNSSIIPFQNISPALSTVIYKNEGNEWNPGNWEVGIHNLDSYEHQYNDVNALANTLVIILGKVSRVDWGDFDTVQNLAWDVIIVFWDLRPNINRVFINTSISGLATDLLVQAIFGEGNVKITGMNVFRIFHDVHRLSLFNVGARKGIGQDISFQSFFGKGVQDGIKMLEQGTLVKNNIFGVGYKDGTKVSLGCSVKGKIWSYLRGNLNEFTEWCTVIGDIVENPLIDPNTVLEHTLEIQAISKRPLEAAIAVDWHPEMYQFTENRYEFYFNGIRYYLWDIDLCVIDTPVQQPLQFAVVTADCQINFEMRLSEQLINGELQPVFNVKKLTSLDAQIQHGTKNESLEEFFQRYTPLFWFANEAQLLQNQYVKPREQADTIPQQQIISQAWPGVSLGKESQRVTPYVQDSIQYNFINQIRDDFELLYDDDGKGEIADIIGINDHPQQIDIHLFHLKYAHGGTVSNNIENFYQVCGQAQKSLNWKYKSGKEFFEHLFRRIKKSENGVSCSRLIKGTEDQLDLLQNAAKWTKAMKFHIYIVQPGFEKANASPNILLLLGNTYHYLHTVGDIELKIYSS